MFRQVDEMTCTAIDFSWLQLGNITNFIDLFNLPSKYKINLKL